MKLGHLSLNRLNIIILNVKNKSESPFYALLLSRTEDIVIFVGFGRYCWRSLCSSCTTLDATAHPAPFFIQLLIQLSSLCSSDDNSNPLPLRSILFYFFRDESYFHTLIEKKK